MLITIPNVLSKDEIRQFREYLDKGNWEDGSNTAGSIASKIKRNQQLDDTKEPGLSLGTHILKTLTQNPMFISAVLPDKIYPPKFNRYCHGESYGAHIDGSLMQIPGDNQTIRTDVSATLFLCEPDEYEGGELTITTSYGNQTIRLPAGDLVLYPSTSLHYVSKVTSGSRVASFFWIQSIVKDIQQRETLFNLDQSIQKLTSKLGTKHQEVINLSGIYHNLIRQWANP